MRKKTKNEETKNAKGSPPLLIDERVYPTKKPEKDEMDRTKILLEDDLGVLWARRKKREEGRIVSSELDESRKREEGSSSSSCQLELVWAEF